MGDIADYLIDQMTENGMWFRRTPTYKQPKCMHCGSTDVFWRPYDGKQYKLHNDDGKPHVCNPIDPNEFTAIKD